jgi:hypothetical protein
MTNLRFRTCAANLCQSLLLQCETTAWTGVVRVHPGCEVVHGFLTPVRIDWPVVLRHVGWNAAAVSLQQSCVADSWGERRLQESAERRLKTCLNTNFAGDANGYAVGREAASALTYADRDRRR